MKKQIILIAILLCTAFAQAQEVFVTADFVSSYIWRGIENGNASVQPSLSTPTTILPKQKKNLSNTSITVHIPRDILLK